MVNVQQGTSALQERLTTRRILALEASTVPTQELKPHLLNVQKELTTMNSLENLSLIVRLVLLVICVNLHRLIRVRFVSLATTVQWVQVIKSIHALRESIQDLEQA